jgi:hypothetical protein
MAISSGESVGMVIGNKNNNHYLVKVREICDYFSRYEKLN